MNIALVEKYSEGVNILSSIAEVHREDCVIYCDIDDRTSSSIQSFTHYTYNDISGDNNTLIYDSF